MPLSIAAATMWLSSEKFRADRTLISWSVLGEMPGGEPRRHDLLDRLAHALHALEEQRDVKVFLGAIVEVDRPDGDLGLAGDVLDRRAREPLLGEDTDGRRLEGLSPGAALAALPVRTPHSSRRIRARAGGR